MKPSISEAEILKALEDASRHTEDGGFTFAELIEATGWGEVQARKRIKLAVQAGKLTCARSPRINIVGEWQSIPVYRFATAKAKRA